MGSSASWPTAPAFPIVTANASQPLVHPPIERATRHQPRNPVLCWNPMVHRQYQHQPLDLDQLYSPLLPPPQSGASMTKRATEGRKGRYKIIQSRNRTLVRSRRSVIFKCIADWARELEERLRFLWVRTNDLSHDLSILGDSTTLTTPFSQLYLSFLHLPNDPAAGRCGGVLPPTSMPPTIGTH